MPHNPTLVPKKHKFKNLLGQTPLTTFKDYRTTITVKLVEPEPKEKLMSRIYGFVNSTWADSPEELKGTDEQKADALTQMLSGKALGLGLESVNLTFLISGISRVDTHQIVRQRIGVVFSQQCTGDRFLNHNDALIEESIAADDRILKEYIDSTLAAKQTYADMVDGGISIQAARAILPHNLETFIWMHTNLSTLLFFHQKRIDDGSQTWQINEIAQQMADQVIAEYPELRGVFDRNKTKFKFQKEAGADRANNFSTSLYVPKVDEYEYHTADFLYPKTKDEMHRTGTLIAPKYFWGLQEVTPEEYLKIKEEYTNLTDQVHNGTFTNEEVLELASATNEKINQTIFN